METMVEQIKSEEQRNQEKFINAIKDVSSASEAEDFEAGRKAAKQQKLNQILGTSS